MPQPPPAVLAYYAAHGPLTDPGPYRDLLDGLPRDLPALCQAVRGLVLHYRADAAAALPRSRLDEVRTRRVAAMLARLVARGPGPLTRPRPPTRRLVGCCRDAATLLCAGLRARGPPARVRVGFADYLAPDLMVDHWLTEVWEPRRGWVRVDAEPAAVVRVPGRPAFDPLDVPRDRFVVAGRAWRACRAGATEPERFGHDPALRGLGVVRANLLHDLACLNKVELTPWDFWGLGLTALERCSAEELALLDRAAALTARADARFAALRALYAGERRLRVPPVVTSYTLGDEPTATCLGPLGP